MQVGDLSSAEIQAWRDDVAKIHHLDERTASAFAFVLWLAGECDEAREILTRPMTVTDPQGWWSAASKSLGAYVKAQDAEPAEVITLLTRSGTDWTSRSLSTIGAMVSRCAYLRMRAYQELGDLKWAAREAWAAVNYDYYRVYDLHVQGPNQEFDVRLVDRVALTHDELREARTVLADNPLEEGELSYIMEGTVYFKSQQ